MQDLVLFGVSGFSKIVAELIAEAGRYRVVGFTQDGDQISEFLGLPVVPFEKLEESFPPNKFHALVAVGYSKMNQVRQQKYLELKARGYSMGSYCCPRQHIPSTVSLGEHHLILDENSLQPHCRVGDNVILWSRNVIGHESEIGSHCFLSSGVIVSGFAKLGEGCFLGPTTVVAANVALGDRVFLGPGAIASEDLADESVLVGPKSDLRKIPSRRLPKF